MVCEIFNFLKDELVVNIFYLYNREVLRQQLQSYLQHGVESLHRHYIQPRGKKSIRICEYKVYKILTFFDYARKLNYAFIDVFEIYLLDYLVDFALSGCTIECVQCHEYDFSTHYIKNTSVFTSVERYPNEMFKLVEKDKFPYREPGYQIVGRSNDHVRSMMLLDFTKCYRVVALRKIDRSNTTTYIITLFSYVEHLNHIMLCGFWLPKSCLSKIKGSRGSVDIQKGYIDIHRDQFIYITSAKRCKRCSGCGGKYGDFCIGRQVEIKSIVGKSIKQLSIGTKSKKQP